MKLPRLLHRSTSPKTALLTFCAIALLAAGWAGHASAGDAGAGSGAPATAPATTWNGRWSEEVLELVATIPVQSQGRVKPLHTWAGFALLGSNHRRSCKDADGNKLKPLEWFMDAVFRPEHSKNHRCFLIATTEVLDAIGLTEDVRERRKIKKRDRYSYNDLFADEKDRRKLQSLAADFHKVDAKKRTRVEMGIVMLETSVRMLEGLNHLVAFAGVQMPVSEVPGMGERFPAGTKAGFMEILEATPRLHALVKSERGAMDPHAGHGHDHGAKDPKLSKQGQAADDVLTGAFAAVRRSLSIGMFPPSGPISQEKQWFAVTDVVGLSTLRGMLDPGHLEAMRVLGDMAASVGDQRQFTAHLKDYHERVRKMAEARGEYEKIEQEVAFYQLDPFGKSLVLYLIAFALLGVTWLRPQWRWLEIAAWGLVWGTLALHTYGIVQRCLIRDRPPISTLYETVIFITGTGVLTMLLIEHMGRHKVALALAPIVGALGLFIGARYEVLKGTDTMPQLVAVLDTNFWLATHVTAISIGYCAGLIAGLIAHVYVLGKVFRIKQDDPGFYRVVGKMVYGTLCFALLFSLVGTILGGIWANDSWGRFWGWDPKENGALLICIAQLAILHGRMGGLFKTFGVCQGAIFGGMIVAFSWWGVNLLGIGLHSYGFTSGVMRGLMIFYGIEAAVMLAGTYAWWRDRPKKKAVAA
ncbi:MAG: cytochrome c biogenesis protein CcsA [Planctomycetota bacterium]|nr:cytochrome c biogenesis protein CcsA [Planctomycetota bacterium]